jgi:translation elongation factor EF-G
MQASPIVKVAIEPVRPTEMSQLEEGLKLLNRADPFVEVSTLDSGEHVIGAAGACSGTRASKADSGLDLVVAGIAQAI